MDISPATSRRTLMWTESQPMQTRYLVLLSEMSKPSTFNTRNGISTSWSTLQQCGVPYQDKTHKVEMVQKRAAWWTLSDYTRMTSVTSLQSMLNWQTLEERWSVARLCLFYKIANGLLALPLPDYMQPVHTMVFRQIHTGKDYYLYTFFPLATAKWNFPS